MPPRPARAPRSGPGRRSSNTSRWPLSRCRVRGRRTSNPGPIPRRSRCRSPSRTPKRPGTPPARRSRPEQEVGMYPSRFRYEAPRSIDEAIALLQEGGGEAKVLAGGQSLIPLLKLRFAAPELVVDINGLPGLDYHTVDADGTIRIGALCRHADLERSLLLAERQPTMAAAAPLVADPIVRNRGTLVGSLCHADPQGDWASVVTALGGYVTAQGPKGRRNIPMADFVLGPFQNALA